MGHEERFLMKRVGGHGDRLPGGVVTAPCQAEFSEQLDNAFGHTV